MDARDLCSREAVVISTRHGPLEVPALRYGLLAVARSSAEEEASGPPYWEIVHLPTGCTFTPSFGLFPEEERACAAMIELSSLRNDWDFYSFAPLREIFRQVASLYKRHGAIVQGLDVRTVTTAEPTNKELVKKVMDL